MTRVLIIDASPAEAGRLAEMLEGSETDITLSFSEATAMLMTNRYDAIVVDIERMPVEMVSNRDVFKFLKLAHGSTFIITSHDDVEKDAHTLKQLLRRIPQNDLVSLANDACELIKQVQARIEANC